MSRQRTFTVLAAVAALAVVSAECPNACSGHGDCGKYDQCSCYRNWQGNDCSLRTCQFGTSHVDSPKGDLDGSNTVSGTGNTIIVSSQMYPMGTTEQFPLMEDTDGNDLTQTGHAYAECSNKGLCDRKTGTCACFVGYEGVACQRASCNLDCNGHGVCKTIRELALLDNGNSYELWDQDTTMGCHCDKGWYGPDCGLRTCTMGTDPLYLDAPQTLRSATWELNIAYPATNSDLVGNYSIRFFDRDGEDWFTNPITAPTGTTTDDLTAACDNILSALRTLPNKVVPSGTSDVTCDAAYNALTSVGTTVDYDTTSATTILNSKLISALYAKNEKEGTAVLSAFADHNVYTFSLAFPGLPGVLQQPEIEYHLDSTYAPTIYGDVSGVYGYDVLSYWSHGATVGEDADYIANLCSGVRVNVVALNAILYTFDDLTTASSAAVDVLELEIVDVDGDTYTAGETKKLKLCLAGADLDSENNQEVFNWDYGTDSFYVSPHLIKLVNADGSAGVHAMVTYMFDSAGDGHFVLMNDVAETSSTAGDYYVYSTDGILQSVHTPDTDLIKTADVTGHARFAGLYGDRTLFTDNDLSCYYNNYTATPSTVNSVEDPFFTRVTTGAGDSRLFPCLSKGDIIYLARPVDDIEVTGSVYGTSYAKNPNLNPYVIEKISIERFNGLSYARYVPEVTTTPLTDDAVAGMVGTTDDDTLALTVSAGVEVDTGIIDYDATASLITDPTPNRYRILLDKSLASTFGSVEDKQGIIYHFTPPKLSSKANYQHTAECSNRGLCNTDTGLCACFKGYTNDNCDTQSALAL